MKNKCTMDGSAADDLKSLKLLIGELCSNLRESREYDSMLDELVESIAKDAGINYREFKRQQLLKSKEYFKPEILSEDIKNSEITRSVSTGSLMNVNSTRKNSNSSHNTNIKEEDQEETDKEFFDREQCEQMQRLEDENIKLQMQSQRLDFLTQKYTPLLEREQDIMKGLTDFVKGKQNDRNISERFFMENFFIMESSLNQRVQYFKNYNKSFENKISDILDSILYAFTNLEQVNINDEKIVLLIQDLRVLSENFNK